MPRSEKVYSMWITSMLIINTYLTHHSTWRMRPRHRTLLTPNPLLGSESFHFWSLLMSFSTLGSMKRYTEMECHLLSKASHEPCDELFTCTVPLYEVPLFESNEPPLPLSVHVRHLLTNLSATQLGEHNYYQSKYIHEENETELD